MFEESQNRFKNYNVGLVHGKLKASEKDSVMREFKANKVQVLVSTTVVEVGVNVPNATVMVILNANRFGIASLHQMRGRVGRSDKQSCCYLVGNATTPEAEERLNAMVASNDGFYLAEKDLEIRGEGKLFGSSQSGANDLFIANLREHKPILDIAKTVAKAASSSEQLQAEITKIFASKEVLT
jgi:ATP-dependent DNA helicase RecG